MFIIADFSIGYFYFIHVTAVISYVEEFYFIRAGVNNMNNRIKYYFSPVPSKRKRQWQRILKHQLYVQNCFVPVYIELLNSDMIICLH